LWGLDGAKKVWYNSHKRKKTMRIGDKVFVRIAHMYATGVIVQMDTDTYLVRVGDEEIEIPRADCTSVDALDKWLSEPT
jgi:hypothetical protein